MLRKNITPVLLQSVILALMLILTPYAMTFTPYEGIYSEGVWNTPFHLDPLYTLRASLIATGLLAGFLSFVLLVWEIIRNNWRGSDFILQISMTLCSLSIGWAAFPYWVNGMFQAFSGNPHVLEKAPVLNFDPKALMPAIWIDGVWYLGVLLIFVVAIIAIPILLLFNFTFSIKHRTWKQGIATAICLAIPIAIFFLSPNYLRWLGD